MSKGTFGKFCLYQDTIFCQEREECLNCNVFYNTFPLPYLDKTIEQAEQVPDKCLTCPGNQLNVCDRCSLLKYWKEVKLGK